MAVRRIVVIGKIRAKAAQARDVRIVPVKRFVMRVDAGHELVLPPILYHRRAQSSIYPDLVKTSPRHDRLRIETSWKAAEGTIRQTL